MDYASVHRSGDTKADEDPCEFPQQKRISSLSQGNFEMAGRQHAGLKLVEIRLSDLEHLQHHANRATRVDWPRVLHL